jgi:hypothetical protein
MLPFPPKSGGRGADFAGSGGGARQERSGDPRSRLRMSEPESVELEAEQEQPRPLVAVFTAARSLVWGVAPLFFARIVYTLVRYGASTPLGVGIGAFILFAAVAVLLQALARRQADPRRSPVRLRVDGDGLRCDGGLVARRGAVRRGTVAPLPVGGARVSIVTRTLLGFEKDLRFIVRAEEDARRLLEVCGVAPAQRSFSFQAAPSVASVAWPLGIATVMLCATAVSAAAGVWTAVPAIPVLVVLATLALLTIGLTYAQTEVRIGVDGVKLSGGDVGEFIGRNEIESVKVDPDRPMQSGTLALRTKAGATFVIRPPARTGFGTRDLAGIADRIAQIRALPPTGAHLREVRGLLTRGERTVWEWIASVRALGAGRADYRTTPFEPDDLAALATDGALSPGVRVAAAIALKSSPAPDAAERVRIAAAACASQEVRVCLQSIVADDDEMDMAGRVDALGD